MLAEWNASFIIQLLAIAVPIMALGIGFVYKWQEKQDTKLSQTCVRTMVLETKVDDHERELEKGEDKFEGIAAQIGSLREQTAGLTESVRGVSRTQTAMDSKLDDLLARGGGS
jgi:uncharacterized protein HemX